MPTTNVNQRVKRIASLDDDDVTKLQAIGINTVEDLSFAKFEDLGDEIGLIKRRKLECISKFLAMRKDPLTGTITLEQIQAKVELPNSTDPSSAASRPSTAENRGGPKVNTNPLPAFDGNPVNYESWQLQAGATIRQTSYKLYLTRPADAHSDVEKERSSELYNMLLSSVSDGSASTLLRRSKTKTQTLSVDTRHGQLLRNGTPILHRRKPSLSSTVTSYVIYFSIVTLQLQTTSMISKSMLGRSKSMKGLGLRTRRFANLSKT